MFRGVNQLSLDTKGRMALPVKYREAIMNICAGQLVMTIDTEERCLLLYPMNEWQIIEKKLEELPSFNPVARRIQRLLIGHATDLELDTSGRILLPQPLRDYAMLDKKVVVLGQGKKFEVWSESHWDERREIYLDAAHQSDDMPEALKSLAL